jgi:DNA-binding LacI/PurR family transcriptional regulator
MAGPADAVRRPVTLTDVAVRVAHRTEMIIVVGSRSTSPSALRAAERLIGVADRYRRNGGRLVSIGQSMPDAYAVVPDNRGGSAAPVDALVTRAGLRHFVLLAGPADLATAPLGRPSPNTRRHRRPRSAWSRPTTRWRLGR